MRHTGVSSVFLVRNYSGNPFAVEAKMEKRYTMDNTRLRIVGSSLLVAAFGFTGLAMTAAPASASTVQSVSASSFGHDHHGNRGDHRGDRGDHRGDRRDHREHRRHHDRCEWNYGWHRHHGDWDHGWYRDCDHGHHDRY